MVRLLFKLDSKSAQNSEATEEEQLAVSLFKISVCVYFSIFELITITYN